MQRIKYACGCRRIYKWDTDHDQCPDCKDAAMLVGGLPPLKGAKKDKTRAKALRYKFVQQILKGEIDPPEAKKWTEETQAYAWVNRGSQKSNIITTTDINAVEAGNKFMRHVSLQGEVVVGLAHTQHGPRVLLRQPRKKGLAYYDGGELVSLRNLRQKITDKNMLLEGVPLLGMSNSSQKIYTKNLKRIPGPARAWIFLKKYLTDMEISVNMGSKITSAEISVAIDSFPGKKERFFREWLGGGNYMSLRRWLKGEQQPRPYVAQLLHTINFLHEEGIQLPEMPCEGGL